ncbi:hypothetical protein DFH07DRAFT_942298 [Mycena maculata]|uniref:Uncharacterized protein n=1 Tax=Mycena maculata TaxID=230809 RepID=A0AAD7N7U5_9AGAR|nr:hypothetical protein DFH07DRAFT_942298 [Mycena maculata]
MHFWTIAVNTAFRALLAGHLPRSVEALAPSAEVTRQSPAPSDRRKAGRDLARPVEVKVDFALTAIVYFSLPHAPFSSPQWFVGIRRRVAAQQVPTHTVKAVNGRPGALAQEQFESSEEMKERMAVGQPINRRQIINITIVDRALSISIVFIGAGNGRLSCSRVVVLFYPGTSRLSLKISIRFLQNIKIGSGNLPMTNIWCEWVELVISRAKRGKRDLRDLRTWAQVRSVRKKDRRFSCRLFSQYHSSEGGNHVTPDGPGRVPEGVQSDPEEAGGSRQTPLEPNANVTDFVEAVHIPDGTRVTGSGPEGGRGNRG